MAQQLTKQQAAALKASENMRNLGEADEKVKAIEVSASVSNAEAVPPSIYFAWTKVPVYYPEIGRSAVFYKLSPVRLLFRTQESVAPHSGSPSAPLKPTSETVEGVGRPSCGSEAGKGWGLNFSGGSFDEHRAGCQPERAILCQE
eukprot:1992226-Amphidinium_carterae.1